jgi:uncharacterized protein (TIGR03382 family)
MRALLIVCLLAAAASAAPVKQSEDDPHPGIHHELWVDAAVPARIHLARIDLTSAELSLYATAEIDHGIKTTTYAGRKVAQLAINGGAFQPAGYKPRGLAMGDMVMWGSAGPDDVSTYVLHFRRVGEHTVATILSSNVVTVAADLPIGTEGVVSGKPLLVRNGVAETSFDSTDPVSIPYTRAPRSAVAVSADGNRMWLATVDGWQQGSIGLTAAELGAFLRARGAHVAMGLDIGGASTMVIDGAVINKPSDGIERTVANHLGVHFGPRETGLLVGAICKTPITACQSDSDKLTGVQVTLDDGRVVTTTAAALLYTFPDVTPRYACVTARKTGYRTKTACQIVTPGNSPPTYNSIQLEPGTDPPPDAGIADASVPDDADDGVDASPRPDAGNAAMGGGGGCCNTGGDHPPAGLVVLVAAVAFGLGRRRGTKYPG